MKKLLSLILAIIILCSMAITAFAEKIQNYEYILPMEYTKIERRQNCYIAYDKQDKCAIYDLNGKKLSDDYDYIGSFFNEQVAEARKDNEHYIINSYGSALSKFDKRIIDVSEYVLVNLTDSNEDGRPPSYYEGEFGVYTYTGELVKALPYEKFKPYKNQDFRITFTGNRLLFTENGKWGAVDNSFNTVIEPVFDRIYPFTDTESGITIAITNSKFGLIDQDGKTVADFVYDEVHPLYDSNNGKINAYKVKQNAEQKSRYGLFDKYGKVIKQLDESEPQTLYEDYKLIKVSQKNTRDDSDQYGYLYGLINYDGNVVIPAENTNIWGISEGIVAAQKAEDQNGYYDISGREITEFKYMAVSLFSEGFAFASSITGGVWTHEVINKNGEVMFNPSNWSGGFYGGIAQIEAGKFIDTNGNIIIDNPEWTAGPELNRQNYKDDGRFIVSDGENCGVAKYTGYISPWAKDSVAKSKKINLIQPGENYNYTAFITREEFCALIFSYIRNIARTLDLPAAAMPFTDTNSTHIGVLNALGIINGKSETEFAPNDSLTREEAAAILCRLINKIYPGWDASAQYFDFADSGQISDWAMNDIQVIYNMGIMQGMGDNRFTPKGLYTTEQAVATLVRVYNNFANSSDISSTENLVDEKFMILSLPWGKKWENIKDRSALSAASVVVDDGNRFAVEISNAEFLGVNGKMGLLFSGSNDAFPSVGLVKAYFTYDEKDEKEILTQGNKIYGERKSYFLDKNGIENPLNPPAWYSDENMDNSLEADERAYFEKLLNDRGVEKTRADAILRGPLVVISVNEDDNIVTINGNKAAQVLNIKSVKTFDFANPQISD